MERRRALKLLAGAAVLPVLSRETLGLFRQVHEQLPSSPALKTFNPHQNATVTAIAELIIPRTETPGAKETRVNEFIDLVITDWYIRPERDRFLAGLADVDSRSRSQFSKEFVDCTDPQQIEIVKALDAEMVKARKASKEISSRRRRTDPPDTSNFFFMMKQLTLIGYYTSEAGNQEELHEEIIPSRHEGCAPFEEESQGQD